MNGGKGMAEYKVIFHIDELNKWELLLKNVTNLIDMEKQEKIVIEVLANSEAVLYYDNKHKAGNEMLTSLSEKGVLFVACNNALMGYKLNPQDIYYFVHIVPAGVYELMIKQSEGYAYIKP